VSTESRKVLGGFCERWRALVTYEQRWAVLTESNERTKYSSRPAAAAARDWRVVCCTSQSERTSDDCTAERFSLGAHESTLYEHCDVVIHFIRGKNDSCVYR